MKYGDILSRAFKTLKSGSLWLYAVTAVFAVAAPFALVGAIWYAAFRNYTFGLPLPGSEAQLLATFLGLYVVFMLGGLLSIPILLIVRGGYIRLTDSILSGAPVTVGEAWSFGARRIGRTFGVEVVMIAILIAAITVIILPFVAIVAFGTTFQTSGSGATAAIGSICLAYVYLLVAIIGFMLIWVGFEQVALRYGLIGGRTFGDAVSSAWQAFRAVKGRFVVFVLIMIGLQYAYQTVTSLITAPLTLAMMPGWYWQSIFDSGATPDPAQVLSSMSGFFQRMALIYPLIIILAVPFMVFAHSAWTAFFRQLTGLDVPSQPTHYVSGQTPAPQPPAYVAPAPPPVFSPTPPPDLGAAPPPPPPSESAPPPVAGYEAESAAEEPPEEAGQRAEEPPQ